MKKLTAWGLALAGILGLVGCSITGTKPFQNLTTEEISSVTVQLQPPDKTLPGGRPRPACCAFAGSGYL